MVYARGYLQQRIALAVVASTLGAPALAGDSGTHGAGAQPVGEGKIVYSRDVHHSVGDAYFPGGSDVAITAPTNAINGVIALGLVPLTDGETARVTASLPQTMINAALSSLVVPEQGALSSQAGALVATDTAALAGGGAIGRAMDALSGALGSLSVITGGRP